ncbi:hypothetical protein J1605_019656 [Eschrichtius robustus]|uniref:Uncharacterized protein n=1 Tax=Eschrichtius robustus TaxID=9764 RepID=A0AB34HHT2_ESCRO|nr:hypothetical protein J1605_019656 [Eschrichtius robustus]
MKDHRLRARAQDALRPQARVSPRSLPLHNPGSRASSVPRNPGLPSREPQTADAPLHNLRVRVWARPVRKRAALAQCARTLHPRRPRRRGESSVERASGRRRVPSGLVPNGRRPSPWPSGVRGVARHGERL